MYAMTDATKESILTTVAEVVKNIGVPAVVSGALLWFGYIQFQAMSAEQSKTNEWVRAKFSTTIENNTAAMQGVTAAVKDSIEVHKEANDSRLEAVKVIGKLDDTLQKWEAEGAK